MNKKTVSGALMIASGLIYGIFVFPKLGMNASPLYLVPGMFLVFGGIAVLSLGLRRRFLKYLDEYGLPYDETFKTMDLGLDPVRATHGAVGLGSMGKFNAVYTYYHFKDTGIHIVKVAEDGKNHKKLFETETPVNSVVSFHISSNSATGNLVSMTLASHILPDGESTTGKALFMVKSRNQFDNKEGIVIIKNFAARHNIPIDEQEANIV